MSIELIDLLKPKNGLNFKLIEDIAILHSKFDILDNGRELFVSGNKVFL